MVAGVPNAPGTDNGGVHELRVRCERWRDPLAELAPIHLETDAPTRRMQADGPDWIGRLRKMCRHVLPSVAGQSVLASSM